MLLHNGSQRFVSHGGLSLYQIGYNPIPKFVKAAESFYSIKILFVPSDVVSLADWDQDLSFSPGKCQGH